jgi:hypothetical protein
MLAAKPPIAMRLNKRRFREITQPAFDEAFLNGRRIQEEAYASGEPQAAMEAFFAARAKAKTAKPKSKTKAKPKAKARARGSTRRR